MRSQVAIHDLSQLIPDLPLWIVIVPYRGTGRRLAIGEKANVLMVLIDLKDLYGDTAKLSLLPQYLEHALRLAGDGHEVVLTGAGPIWLYLKIAHALHGKAKTLIYRSPVTGDVVIFDHDPF